METVGVLAFQKPPSKGCRGWGRQRIVVYTPLASSSPGPFLSGLYLSNPMVAPILLSLPSLLQAHIFGVKGIIASTAELVAALGAVKVHAASSGKCV